MVEQHIALAQHREQALLTLQLTAGAGHEGMVFELRVIERGDLHGVGQADGKRALVDLERCQLHVVGQDLAHPSRHVGTDFQTYGATEVPPADEVLRRLEEIVSFVFLDLQIGVAGDPEGVGAGDVDAGEQEVDVRRHDLLEPDEGGGLGEPQALAVAGPAFARRKGLQAPEGVWHLDPREAHAEGRVLDLDRQIDAQVRDVWERMPRIERQWCEGG